MNATELTDNLISESGYAYIPKELYSQADGARRLPLCAVLVGAVVYSFSSGGKVCTRSYKALKRDLGLSNATIGRSFKALKERGFIAAEKQSSYVFENGKASGKLYQRADYYLFTSLFKFRNEPEPRRLTPAEAHILALFVTRCDNVKRKDKGFNTSFSEIAAELNLSKKTVFTAVKNLVSAKLVYYADKGVNGSVKSKFYLNAKLLRRTKKATRAADKALTSEERSTQRARIYAERRQAAERKADRNLKTARADKEFKAADDGLTKAVIEEARAEALNLPTLADLSRRRAELQERRQRALKRLKLSDNDLTPQYRCKLCNDTGYKENGQPCGCLDVIQD